MPTHSQSLTHASIDQQLVHLQGVIDNVEAELRRIRLAAVTDETYENIDKIRRGLELLREKADLLEEERQHLATLAETEYLVTSTLELDEVLEHIIDLIIRLTGAERAFLLLANDANEMEVRLARSSGAEKIVDLNNENLAISQTVVKRAIWQRSAVLTTDAMEDPRFGNQMSVTNNNLRSILCVPLQIKEQIVGMIYADNRIRSGLFTRKEMDLVTSFANQAAVALENARLFSNLRQSLAEVTALTNLQNSMFGSINSAVFTLDDRGCVQLCNPQAARLLGGEASGLVGRDFQEIAPELSAVVLPGILRVMIEGCPVTGEEARANLPGLGMLDLRFDLSPLRDEHGATQGVTIVMDDLTETKRLKALRALFERMVSPAVIHQLQPENLAMGGKRTELTVMFVDLRGFTPFSENQPPEELVQVLNLYLAAATEAILREGGTVDKFLGDAVMAWFNAPIAQSDHTLRAVRSAMGICAAVEQLHASLPAHQHLWFGSGIHRGDAVLGLVGSEQRLEYTAIGDCVNTARRIQENAEPGQILLSEAAYWAVAANVNAAAVSPIHAKGKTKMPPVYAVLSLK